MTAESSKLENSSFDQRVGEVVTFVGLKGVMKVRPSLNNPALFLDIKNVLLKPAKELKSNKDLELDKELKADKESKLAEEKESLLNDIRSTIEDIKLVKNFLHLQLNSYESRNAVEHFRGFHVFTSKSELRDLDKNEWWVKDLIGLEVYTPDGKLIGTVYDAPGEHGEFLEIKKANDSNSETVIVSFVKELFPVVDLKSRRIVAIDLPGLFE